MTTNTKIDKPHDKLVRRLLSNVTTAREILEVYLPIAVKKLIDLNSLKQERDTFVNREFQHLEVDVLFKAKYKLTDEDCYIWCLIEHQRSPDVWLPLRLFCYLGTIWDSIRKASKIRSKSASLPFIYPLVISNASTPYRHSLTLRDLIRPIEAQPLFDNLFSTPAQLIDLAIIPDEKLRATLQGRVQAEALLLSLKHVFDQNLDELLQTHFLPAFQILDQQGYRDEVADLLYYLYHTGNLRNSSKFWSFLQDKFSQETGEKIMGLGEQAELKALQRGLQQGKRETALRMLDEKFDIKIIAKITQLLPDEIKRLAKERTFA